MLSLFYFLSLSLLALITSLERFSAPVAAPSFKVMNLVSLCYLYNKRFCAQQVFFATVPSLLLASSRLISGLMLGLGRS